MSPGFFQLGNLLAGQVLSTWQVTLSTPFGSIPVFGPGAPSTNGYSYCVWFGSNSLCNPAANSSPTNPIFPASPVPVVNPRNPAGPPSWIFRNAGSGGTFDPPFVSGFQYDGVSGTRFDRITLPTGFGSSFTVWTGSGFSTSLGTFAAGTAVDFVLGGVDAFQIRNIAAVGRRCLGQRFSATDFF